ncbi:hypothetical protein NX794_33135 [Streptomyces sp. LP11]|uniref:DUF1963 domain-containing protein n=1 Tax=Streptomyces pyxinicus TaxID=2970331 RepID=A0ABT2BC45_9ACTN|nr:hypothetical protein [Streptomyces sp. LP11]MCS0606017.1 hypothetical protein [Streptomyces sp. LP11]
MVKSHGKKQRARKKAQRTGAGYASAAAGTTHEHTPLPDMAVLEKLPHVAGRDLDLELAARLVAACRSRCRPCQRTLAEKLRTEQRPTLTALAAAVYATLPSPGFIASSTTQGWAPTARAGKADPAAAAEALATVEAMDDAAASDLLEDALDHWAVGGASAEEIADMVTVVPEAPPRQRPADPMDLFREAGVKVFTLDDLDLGDDVDTYALAPAYGVMPMQTSTPDGQPMPMLLLYPETDGAGIEDLEARTDWEHWGLHGMPDMDPLWRVRARIADRSLQGLVHVGPDGEDDVELWRATQSVSLPADWWDLLDRVQHLLVVGPVADPEAPGAMEAAGDAGELLAVVARVAFV